MNAMMFPANQLVVEWGGQIQSAAKSKEEEQNHQEISLKYREACSTMISYKTGSSFILLPRNVCSFRIFERYFTVNNNNTIHEGNRLGGGIDYVLHTLQWARTLVHTLPHHASYGKYSWAVKQCCGCLSFSLPLSPLPHWLLSVSTNK